MKIKESFQGTSQVFKFTLTQLVKSKTNIITLVIAFVIALASIPVSSLGSGKSENAGELNTVYVDNSTNINLDGLEKEIRELDEIFTDVNVVFGKLPENEKKAIGITLTLSDVLELDLAWNDRENITAQIAYGVGYMIYDYVDKARNNIEGISEQDKAMLNLEIRTSVTEASYYEDHSSSQSFDDGEIDGGSFNQDDYNAQLGFSVFLMMLCVYSISFIIRAVIEEKSSKLVDLLMVSIKPGALMLGKVLAVLVFVVLYMAVLLGGMLLSLKITPLFMEVGSNGFIGALATMNISFKGMIVTVITGALGVLAFGILAALSGAGCSNMEDSGGAMGTCMLLIMGGYMVSLFISMASNETLKTVFCIIPVLSMFVAPLQFMNGSIGFGIVVISWIIQFACCVLLLLLTAKVYKDLIIYKGKRIGMKEILKMAGGKEAL